MKYLMILLLPILLVAQNGLPEQLEFTVVGMPTHLNSEEDYFKINDKFQLGWQWDMHRRMSDAMGANFGSGFGYTATGNTWLFADSLFPDSANVSINTQYLWNGDNPIHGAAMQWDAANQVPSNDKMSFHYEDDDLWEVFGFANVSGTTSEGRQEFYTSESYVNPVLSGNNFNDAFYKKIEDGEISNTFNPGLDEFAKVEQADLRSVNFYLSINLRRVDSTVTTKDNEGVLEIKIPWLDEWNEKTWFDKEWSNWTIDSSKIWDKVLMDSVWLYEHHRLAGSETGSIKFDSIPPANLSNAYKLYGDHGYSVFPTESNPTTNSVIITRAMIPCASDGIDNDITLTMHFRCNDAEDDGFNRFLDGHNALDSNTINELGIEINYLGNLDVAIDWVRIETPTAQWLSRGLYDDEIKASLVTELEWWTQSQYTSRGIRMNRFKAGDEFLTDQWFAHKYLRYLIGDVITAEIDSKNRDFMARYVDMAETWTITGATQTDDAMPFIVDGNVTVGGTQMDWGLDTYTNSSSTIPAPHDSLQSAYETILWRGDAPGGGYYDLIDFDEFDPDAQPSLPNYFGAVPSIQAYREVYTSKLFYENALGILYSETPFIAQLQILGSYGWDASKFFNYTTKQPCSYNPMDPDCVPYVVTGYDRQETKEEIAQSNWYNLVLGAKGLIYDGLGTENFDVTLDTNNYPHGAIGDINLRLGVPEDMHDALGISSTVTGWDYLNLESTGGDFLVAGHPMNMDVVINLDYNAEKYKIDPDRYYIGQKTGRRELKKTFDWVHLVEDELLDLRLQAWYSKGFSRHYSQNTDKYGTGVKIMKNYFDPEAIRTKKLFRPNWDYYQFGKDHNYNPTAYEAWDSSFYEVTILEHKDTTLKDYKLKTLYIGIQNRRTDPLIFVDHPSSATYGGLHFFSGAEFDDYAQNGGDDLFGVSQNAAWWTEQWWRRLGAREITIPFDLKPWGNGHYMEVYELGVNDLSSLGWWYGSDYYDKIDTSLSYNDDLKIKLLPGDGKILKVRFKTTLPGPDSCYSCDIVNDFDKVSISATAVFGEACCYDIELEVDSDCPIGDLPIRIMAEGFAGMTLDATAGSLDPSGKYYFDLTRDVSGTTTDIIDLGRLCKSGIDTDDFKLEVLFGEDFNGKFYGCDRKIEFDVECGEQAVDCCESLESVTFTSTVSEVNEGNGNVLLSYCCNTIEMSGSTTSDCFYSIDIRTGSGYSKELLSEINGLDLSSSATLGSFCHRKNECIQNDSNSIDEINYVTWDLLFRGKDGEIICEKPIVIGICCGVILDYNSLDLYGLIDLDILEGNKESYGEVLSEELEVLSDLMVIPNPSVGSFRLDFNLGREVEVQISVLNIYGKQIWTKNGSYVAGMNTAKIELSNPVSGMYYVNINIEGEQITIPVVVNK